MKKLLFLTAEKLPEIADLFLRVRSNFSEVLLIFNAMFYTTDLEAPHLKCDYNSI